jgi:chromosomal replication initiation ATPase DnaA
MIIKSPQQYSCSSVPIPYHPRHFPTVQLAGCPLEQIILQAACELHTTVTQLPSSERRLHSHFMRQVAMFLCRELTGASFPFIGKHFNRHHATVIHAIHQVAQRIDREPAFRQFIEGLQKRLPATEPTTEPIAA